MTNTSEPDYTYEEYKKTTRALISAARFSLAKALELRPADISVTESAALGATKAAIDTAFGAIVPVADAL